MATRFIWLTCCCWASRIQWLRPHAPSPKEGPAVRPHRSARSVFGTRHPGSDSLPSRKDPPQPSAAPACQGAAPRDATTSARLLRHCRFTRSIRPPVPRSGVAPHRSPQSLPCLPPPCQGPGTRSLRPAVPSETTRQESDSSFPGGDAPCRIQQLWEPHQFT
jgi:hypothetical protein